MKQTTCFDFMGRSTRIYRRRGGNGVGGSMELLKAFKSRPGTYGWKHSPGEQIKVKN